MGTTGSLRRRLRRRAPSFFARSGCRDRAALARIPTASADRLEVYRPTASAVYRELDIESGLAKPLPECDPVTGSLASTAR